MSKPSVPALNSSGRTLLSIPRVRELLDRLVEGERLEDAADALGIRRRRARLIMRDPAFRRQFFSEIEDLKQAERARNFRLQQVVRDRGFAPTASAAEMKVALTAVRDIEGTHKDSAITINGGNNVIAGYVVKLDGPAEGPRVIGNSGTDHAKPLIEHEE